MIYQEGSTLDQQLSTSTLSPSAYAFNPSGFLSSYRLSSLSGRDQLRLSYVTFTRC